MIAYTPNFIPQTIVIFGVGGTGSRLVPLVAQFVKTCPWILNPHIILVDDDVVEEKNLLRQNFIASDVGKHKAEVLAQRYSRAYNIRISPLVHRVVEPDSFLRMSNTHYAQCVENIGLTSAMFILCVDSPAARRSILKQITALVDYSTSRRYGNLIIDSGNETDFGQVTINTISKLTDYRFKLDTIVNGNLLPEYPLFNLDIPQIPIDLNYFSSMASTTTVSCADLDQTMAINCTMATTILGVIQNFYYVKPFTYDRINVSLSHGTQLEYMTLKSLFRKSLTESNDWINCLSRISTDKGFTFEEVRTVVNRSWFEIGADYEFSYNLENILLDLTREKEDSAVEDYSEI